MKNLRQLPNPAQQQKLGIKPLRDYAVPSYSARESTSMGDRRRAFILSGTAWDGLERREAFLTDIAGQGQGSLQFSDKPEGAYTTVRPIKALRAVPFDPTRPQETRHTIQAAEIYQDIREGQSLTRQQWNGQRMATSVTYEAFGEAEIIKPVEGDTW